MPSLQAANPNLTNQEDFVKCLSALYGNSSAEILQKLPPLNDWPIQSISPPDYSRITGGPCGSGSSNINANVDVRGTSGLGFNNSIANSNIYNSNNNSGQQKQHEIQQQLVNSQHQTASNVSQFRVSSLQQTPQQLSQQKSVLSLHQRHQNDLSNRRLNHHLNTTSASYANINTANSSSNITNNSTNVNASSSSSTLDPNNLNAFSSILNKASSTAVVPNIMNTLASNDNMIYDRNLAAAQQEFQLYKQRHSQRYLKNSSSQIGPLSSSPSPMTTTTTTTTSNISSQRNDLMPHRNIASNNMTSSPMSSQGSSAISPPNAAFSSVPKSLLNLAACSSTSPSSTSTSSLPSHSSKFSSMVNQMNLKSGRSINQTHLNNNNNRPIVKNSCGSSTDLGDIYCQRSNTSVDNQNSLLQHVAKSSASESNNNSTITRSSSKQLQWSLLSEDQSSRQPNLRTASNASLNTVTPNHKTLTPSTSYKLTTGSSSKVKETFLADLQERAARAGVSIGEINKPIQPADMSISSSNAPQQDTVIISPNQSKDDTFTSNLVDRKEIESALSRVEARNDLSLLYPPMLLAANSQKQINALSAGLQGAEDTEVFTKEVKKIILEECNIIYECKACNNLFRSLANLVKHKRTYCLESSLDRTGMDINKRSFANTSTSVDQSIGAHIVNPTTLVGNMSTDQELNQEQVSAANNRYETRNAFTNSQNTVVRTADRRQNSTNDLRILRIMRNQEKKNNQEREVQHRIGAQNSSSQNLSSHASLAEILQSQPKNRLPASRDNSLLSTLSLTSTTSTNTQSNNTYDNAKGIECSTSDVNESLVRNSSLAKTLLNEKVKNNPRQSLIELSKVLSADSEQPRLAKRVAPKRKFLEDCIQKVKRDKLLTEDEEEQSQLTASNSSATLIRSSNLQGQVKGTSQVDQDIGTASDLSKFNSPDADDDSDKLEIDLDGLSRRSSFKRSRRRVSTAASSTASSNSSSTRLNSSSALLKALTRPVDTRRSVNTALISCDKESSDQLSIDQCRESENITIKEEKNCPEQEAPSPLFETYACDICDSYYEDLDSLMNHTIEQHEKEKMVYPCIFCSLSFIALENVCRHIVDIHKKPKAQVQRLKEVVRSRSHVSTDFLACCDYPPSALELKNPTPIDVEPIEDTIKELVEAEDALLESIMKSEGMKTREKKRVDYNRMVNSNNLHSETLPSRCRKSRSKSADQALLGNELSQDEIQGKAASVDGDMMELGQNLIGDEKVSADVEDAKHDSVADTKSCNSQSSSNNHDAEVHKEFLVKDRQDGSNDIEDSDELMIDDEEDKKEESLSTEKDPIDAVEVDVDDDISAVDDDSLHTRKDTNQRDEDVAANDESNSDSESTSSSGSYSTSSSSSSSSINPSGDDSSSSGSDDSDSGSSSSSSSSNPASAVATISKTSKQQEDPESQFQANFSAADDDDLEIVSCDEDSSDEPKQSTSNKQTSPNKDQKSDNQRQSSQLSNESDSEANGESEDFECDSSPMQADETASGKQDTPIPSSSSKSNIETTPSSVASGSGGIMKLKIQLKKTRPDEKSKFYEIAR